MSFLVRRFRSRLKERFPHMFQDLCLYCEVSDVLGLYKFRLHIRRFVQGLFANVIFDPVSEGVIWHRLCGSWCPHPLVLNPLFHTMLWFVSRVLPLNIVTGLVHYSIPPFPPPRQSVLTASERFLYHPLPLVGAKFHVWTFLTHCSSRSEIEIQCYLPSFFLYE